MHEDIRNFFCRLWPKFCERLTHNLHDLGIALVPAFYDKLLWIALFVTAIFVVLTAVQTLISEAS